MFNSPQFSRLVERTEDRASFLSNFYPLAQCAEGISEQES